MFWIGYAVCLLFPIPFINSTIISLWSAYGSKIMGFFTVSNAEVLATEAVTAIETIGKTPATNTVAAVAPATTTKSA
jgi:hypothetical protein